MISGVYNAKNVQESRGHFELPPSRHFAAPPLSANPSSRFTSDRVEDVRNRVLSFFNANPQDYQVGVDGYLL